MRDRIAELRRSLVGVQREADTQRSRRIGNASQTVALVGYTNAGKSRLMRRGGKQAALSAASRHFTTPSRDFALIARKLTGLFNFIAALDAEFNAHDMVESHIRRWRAREQRGAKK